MHKCKFKECFSNKKKSSSTIKFEKYEYCNFYGYLSLKITNNLLKDYFF